MISDQPVLPRSTPRIRFLAPNALRRSARLDLLLTNPPTTHAGAPAISHTRTASLPGPGRPLPPITIDGDTLTLIIFKPSKLFPSLHSVLPQSGQKCDVMVLPLSGVLEISLGLPERSLKPDSATAMLVV